MQSSLQHIFVCNNIIIIVGWLAELRAKRAPFRVFQCGKFPLKFASVTVFAAIPYLLLTDLVDLMSGRLAAREQVHMYPFIVRLSLWLRRTLGVGSGQFRSSHVGGSGDEHAKWVGLA